MPNKPDYKNAVPAPSRHQIPPYGVNVKPIPSVDASIPEPAPLYKDRPKFQHPMAPIVASSLPKLVIETFTRPSPPG